MKLCLAGEYGNAVDNACIRLLCAFLRTKAEANAVPLELLPQPEVLPAENMEEAAAELLLKHLPIPDELTPLEQIIDFRSSEDAVRWRSSLRRWIHDVGATATTRVHLEDEIEGILEDYKYHLKRSRVRYRLAQLRAIIKVLPETAENIVKLRLSKITDPLFEIGRNRLDLLDTEADAPGRELAYLFRAEQEFASK